MRVGSLFSGIGGLDLGLERAGMSVVWQCECDPYARAVLRKRWPEVGCYEDVRLIRGDEAPWVDVLCGGFPCQPVSKAGSRRGREDDRWLWPEFARLVREIRPRYVLMENVPGLLLPYEYPRGSGRWRPAAIEEVLGDLAACGYDAEWDGLPAAAFGANHLRDRVFIVAYPYDSGRMDGQARVFTAEGGLSAFAESRASGEMAHPEGDNESFEPTLDGGQRAVVSAGARAGGGARSGHPAEGVSVGAGVERDGSTILADANDAGPGLRREQPAGWAELERLARWWAVEPDVARMADGVPSRVDRIRGLGNAVVPQVAEWIGRQIMSREDA